MQSSTRLLKAGLRACFFLTLTTMTGAYGQDARPPVATPATAQTVSALGFTGIGLTPSSRPAGWGELSSSFHSVIPGSPSPKGYNFLFNIGFLPGAEVNGRLATQNLQCNLYGLGDNPCRGPVERDVSASFKFGHSVNLENGWLLSGSLGTTDYGGAATLNRSYYGVIGAESGSWAATAGYGRKSLGHSPLQGGFASLAWSPSQLLTAYSEVIANRAWLGAKVFLPERLSPAASRVYVGAQFQIYGDNAVAQKSWVNLGVTIQMDKPSSAAKGARAVLPADAPPWAQLAADVVAPPVLASQHDRLANLQTLTQPSTLPPATDDKWPSPLAQGLSQAGFEDISIGRAHHAARLPRWVIRFENSGYNWNDLDGVGAALAQVVRRLPPGVLFDLQLTRRGINTLRVLGQSNCLASWLQQQPCPQGEPISVLAAASARMFESPLDSELEWVVKGERASAGRSRLYVTPAFDSRVGSEYGTFDSSWALGLTLQTPLWKGAHADLFYARSLGYSSDYAPGGVFADWRIDNLLYRAMVHQAVDLGAGFTARVAAGRLNKVLEGGLAEVRWQPADGRHMVAYEAAQFDHRQVPFRQTYYMGTYRYFSDLLQTQLEFKSGKFWFSDKGQLITARHWFGDTSFEILIRRTQFPEGVNPIMSAYGSKPIKFAGAIISFPLTPRREHRGDWLQFRGDDRFAYGLVSVVGETANYGSPYFGRLSPVSMTLDGTVFNYDRMSDKYVQSNLHRIRQAAERFGD